MSMLAERKRKQKWCLNPRGMQWSQDSNKFGQKLLEKMGWSAGKGLGAKEDGITEHIRVYHKSDSKGMGYKETDDQWTQHESNFSQLLNSLSGLNGNGSSGNVNKLELESLEKKSENSRARLHYRKFTRGKDLSRYSEKDLANIFGKKNLKEEHGVKNNESMQESNEENNKSFGVETHNKGSMIDYFKKKMLRNKKFALKKEVQSPNIETDFDEEITRVGFGFSRGIENKVQSTFLSYIGENSHNGIQPEESKEIKSSTNLKFIKEMEVGNNFRCELSSKRCLKRNNESELELAFTPLKKKFKYYESLNSLQDDEKIEETPKKKCKKKKVKKENLDKNSTANALDKSEEYGRANSGFDPISNTIVVKKHFLDVIKEENENLQNESPKQKPVSHDEEIVETPLQKKKKNLEHKNSNDSDNIYTGLDIPSGKIEKNEDMYLEKNISKKKKKSKAKKGIDNSCFEDIQVDTSFSSSGDHCQSVESINTFNIELDQKTKKFKKKKKSQSYTENSAFHKNMKTLADEMEYPDSERKKIEIATENSLCNGSTFYEEKKKIRSKKNDNCDENYKENIQVIQDFDECLQNFQHKTSKTKRKKENKCGGTENPCFNLDDSSESTEKSNSLYEVKKKKKKVNLGIDNAGLNISSSSPEKCGAKQVKFPLQLEMPIMDEIILNVVDTPILKNTQDVTPIQKRKSVRFSEMNQSIFMNNGDSPADLLRNCSGVHNEAYDELGNRIEENIDSLSKQLDDFQAEVENDINQAKFEVMVGEMGDPCGENEILPDGDVKLKFKYANFGKVPPWLKKNGNVNARTSYRHLIKGDIILGFKNTNLHEIEGYDQIKKSNKN